MKREGTTLTPLVEQSYSVSRNSCGPLMSLERRSSPFYLAIIIVFATYCIVADRKIKHRRPTTNYYYYIYGIQICLHCTEQGCGCIVVVMVDEEESLGRNGNFHFSQPLPSSSSSVDNAELHCKVTALISVPMASARILI